METKGELDLQQWQRDILAMEDSKEAIDDLTKQLEQANLAIELSKEIPLTITQANMLEKVIGDDFFITDSKIRETLEVVLEWGFYYEKDRRVLNLARECYLKGRNWVK